MTVEVLDRAALKDQARETLKEAQVSVKGFTALYLGLGVVLNVIAQVASPAEGAMSLLGIFATVLTGLTGSILSAGFVLYCMSVRRGERAEYLTLFDGFSMVGKLIGLQIMMSLFIGLWSMLFVIPGIIAAYRYQFALYNLLENPELGILEAISLSKRQTMGYKGQLFMLDLSYFGWIFLSALPLSLYQMQLSAHLTATLYGDPTVVAAPSMVFLVLSLVWTAAVQLFYVAQYQCVHLAYYDAAKRTSGLDPLHGPAASSGPVSPDGLGGL